MTLFRCLVLIVFSLTLGKQALGQRGYPQVDAEGRLDFVGSWTGEISGHEVEMVFWDSPSQKLGGLLYAPQLDCVTYMLGTYTWSYVETARRRPEIFLGLHVQSLYANLNRHIKGNCPAADAETITLAGVTQGVLRHDPRRNDVFGTDVYMSIGNLPKYDPVRTMQGPPKVSFRLSSSEPSEAILRKLAMIDEPRIARPSEGPLAGWTQYEAPPEPPKPIERRYTGDDYVMAVATGNTETRNIIDWRWRRPFEQMSCSTTGPNLGDFERLLSGRDLSNDAQKAALCDRFESASHIAAVAATYILNFDSIYADCLGPNPPGIPVTTQWIETTTYGDLPPIVRARPPTERTWYIKPELYPYLEQLVLSDPAAAIMSDGLLGLLAGDPLRVDTSSVTYATQRFMSAHACNSDTARQFEANLFEIYDVYAARQARAWEVGFSD